MEMFASGMILAIAGIAAIIFLWIQRPVTSTKTNVTSTTAAPRASAVKQGRGVSLIQVSPSAKGSEGTHNSPETDSGIDIIAIHGFDTASPRTWEFKKEDGGKVNWLADKHMLPAEVPGTRIFTCDWPAEGLETKDSVPLRIQELALSLLQGILGSDMERKRPILFVASCLGGIILMQALVEAKDEYASIREATRGVIFLATPFRGTSFQEVAMWALPGLRIKASIRGKNVSKLLDYLNAPTFDLTRLVGQFTRLCKGRDSKGFEVFTFYETEYTYLAAQASFLSYLLPGSKKQLVDMSSATLDSVPNPLPLHRNHSRMNKFCGPLDSDPDYKSVVEVIQRFIGVIRTGTILEQADAWIREKHYDKQRLKIERLSGDSLEMSQCYINLALVEMQKDRRSEATPEGPSPFSLAERLKLEAPHDDLRVELPNLFDPRQTPDGNKKTPRRILIRGRAGVGKTTLCKKIVYDFIHGGMWQGLFKRVLWIRLRELKSLPDDNYSLDKVFKKVFFQQHSQHTFLSDQMCNKTCTELWRQIEETQSRDTLFLLDGLDEVPELTMEYRHGNPHPGQELLKGILNRPNVIITTRPHATFPTSFRQPDLQLDTMGFSQDQVQTYIEAVIPEETDTIRAYLEKHQIMQSLVQIPIQLDALCFTWQASSIWNTVIPDTMTAVYDAMVKELWRKDNERLEKDGFQVIGNTSPAETDPFDSTQYEDLAYVAFSGLCSNVIEFQPHHRNKSYRFMKKNRTTLSFDETFARLSFWRTSEPSNSLPNQSYHFIHLTFQEYFAAKHFTNAWRYEQDLEYVEFDGGKAKKQVIPCRQFLEKHKFTSQYNIMWRFVAGILDEDEEQSSRFFDAIGAESIDMLGPTQQRLVMHCLAEVTESADLRTRVEEQLSLWLEFEINFLQVSRLVSEADFPGRAIDLVLGRASEECRIETLRSLVWGRRILPPGTVDLITGHLKSDELSRGLRVNIIRTLLSEYVPIRNLDALIALMDDDDDYTRDGSVRLLERQADWPDNDFRVLMSRVGSQDSDTDPGIKERTARALGSHSTLSEGLIRRMTLWMEDQHPSTTKAVLQTLGHQCKLDEDVIRSIAKRLADEQQDIRDLAFRALQERKELPLDIVDNMVINLEADIVDGISTPRDLMNRLSDNILRAVIGRLESQDANIQQKALRVFCYKLKTKSGMPSHDAFDTLGRWLEGGDNDYIHLALTLLEGESELPERIAKAVMTQLDDQDQEIRRLAFAVLLVQRFSYAGVINKTIGYLQSQDSYMKRAILGFLDGAYLLQAGILKAIVEQLDDRDRHVREAALETLSRFGNRGLLPNDILSIITKQIFHANDSTRRAAALTLAEVWERQGSPTELLKDIVAELKNDDAGIRKAALEGLVVLGVNHSFLDWIFDAIAVHLADPEQEIRYATVETLAKLAHKQTFPDQVLRAIAALLKSSESEIRCKALETIERLGSRQSFQPETLEIISAQLADRWENNGHYVLRVLAEQPRVPEILQAMVVSGLKESDWQIRCDALDLARRLRKMSEEVHRLVVAILDDEHEEVRVHAVGTLASHGNLADNIYPAVARLLRSQDRRTRQRSMVSLATCPTLPGQIIQEVTSQLNHHDDRVRLAVLEVLAAQHRLPDTILESAAFYPLWLKISFQEEVYCSIEDGVTYLNLAAGFGRRPLWGEPNEFREAICKRQMELGMPVRSTEIDRRL